MQTEFLPSTGVVDEIIEIKLKIAGYRDDLRNFLWILRAEINRLKKINPRNKRHRKSIKNRLAKHEFLAIAISDSINVTDDIIKPPSEKGILTILREALMSHFKTIKELCAQVFNYQLRGIHAVCSKIAVDSFTLRNIAIA